MLVTVDLNNITTCPHCRGVCGINDNPKRPKAVCMKCFRSWVIHQVIIANRQVRRLTPDTDQENRAQLLREFIENQTGWKVADLQVRKLES